MQRPIDGVVTTAKLVEMIGNLAEKGDLIVQAYDVRTVLGELRGFLSRNAFTMAPAFSSFPVAP